jgi:hypothetical protein
MPCGIVFVYLDISDVVPFQHVSKDARTRRTNNRASGFGDHDSGFE